MKIILFSVLFLSSIPLFPQANTSGIKKLDQLKEEDVFQQRLSQCIPWKEKYRYAEFQDGHLFYASRKESDTLRLNYNLLFQQAVRINEQDTAFVVDFDVIKYILIKDDLYYKDYQKGYFEIISNPNDSIRLAVQRKLKILERKKMRDGEKPQLYSTKKNFSVVYNPVNPTFPKEKVILTRETLFFLLDAQDNIYLATKANFLQLFPKHQKQIRQYLKQKQDDHRIKLHNENDLKKLTEFCSSL